MNWQAHSASNIYCHNLNNDAVAVLLCLSPIDDIGLPYFKKNLTLKTKIFYVFLSAMEYKATLLTQKKEKSFMLIRFDGVPLTIQRQNVLPKFSPLMKAK